MPDVPVRVVPVGPPEVDHVVTAVELAFVTVLLDGPQIVPNVPVLPKDEKGAVMEAVPENSLSSPIAALPSVFPVCVFGMTIRYDLKHGLNPVNVNLFGLESVQITLDCKDNAFHPSRPSVVPTRDQSVGQCPKTAGGDIV